MVTYCDEGQERRDASQQLEKISIKGACKYSQSKGTATKGIRNHDIDHFNRTVTISVSGSEGFDAFDTLTSKNVSHSSSSTAT